MNRRKCFYPLVIIMMIFTMQSCKTTSSTAKGSITGLILLDGETDHSGIVVSIFTAGLVPEKVRQIRQDYPQLAFPINDQVIFDHRDFAPLKTVFTSETGSFAFEKLPYGEYIIAYSKEGWGYNYLYDLRLDSEKLILGSEPQLSLYEEIMLPNMIGGNFILESDKCYVADSDVVLDQNASLLFGSNARLLLKPYVKIIAQGIIMGPQASQRAYVTSYSGVHPDVPLQMGLAEGLQLIRSGSQLENLSLSYLSIGLKVQGSDQVMNRLSFTNCVTGLTINAATNASLSNSFFANNLNTNSAACYSYDVQGLSASYNVFYNNFIAQKHEIVKNALMRNNAYIDNDIGFQNLWESTALFEHNYIVSDGSGVENSGKSNLEILSNELHARIGVKTYTSYDWIDTPTLGWTKANNNIFDCEEYSVSCKAVYYFGVEPMPLDFKHNYWNSTSIAFIEASILDYYDLPPYDGPLHGVHYGIIEFLPFRNSLVADAGIQPE